MRYVLMNLQWFALLIGALVFFHELGHFVVAKAFGVKVVRFSLGFGPKIIAFTWGETEYTLSLLPLGGYVKMIGETPGDMDAGENPARALGNRPLYQRALIVLAGPAFNMILALVVYFGMFVGPHTFGDTRLGIVTEGDAAYAAGIRPGDRVLAVDGVTTERWDELRDAIAEHPGKTLSLTVQRDGVSRTVPVTTGSREEEDAFAQPLTRGKMGVSLQYVLPFVAVVDPTSPAATAGVQSGDRITRVGQTKIQAWHEARDAIAAAGRTGPIPLTLQRGSGAEARTLDIAIRPGAFPKALAEAVFSAADVPVAEGYTGLVSQDVVVAQVDPNTPASAAGLQVGDRLLALSLTGTEGATPPSSAPRRRLVGVWGVDLTAFGMQTQQQLNLEVQRGQTVLAVPVRLQEQHGDDEMKNAQKTYVFGATNNPELMDSYTFERPVGAVEALAEASRQVTEDMTLIGRGIGKMVRGDIPMANMGGPIMLFVIAEKSAKRGWTSFMRALAMTSVNLGLLNVLPVPVLDGGHLLFFAIEAVTRRPPSIRAREIANMVGMGLLLMLMVVVFRNDVMRFFFSGH